MWDKKQPEKVSFAMAELIYTSFTHTAKIISCSRSEIGNKISNNKQLAKANPNKKIHPTQKPVSIYKELLNRYAKEDFKIIDPNHGSGSLSIACHDFNYELVACELDVDHYNDSIERIKNHISQLKLF
ncbi:DNA methyltransferase [Chryseobacterium balustinum]|uniref:DNA methyltransferase n=1 Tax=Chryseobacterium balustinum TaxID=246 RepID=UPI003CF63F17